MRSKIFRDVQGTVSKSREVSGLVLTDTTFDSGQLLPRHSHQNAHFCLLLEGAFTEVCSRRTLECKPMSLSFLAAGETHLDRFHGSRTRCFIIDIAPQWIELAGEHRVEFDGAANFQTGILSHTALKLHQEFYRKDAASSLAIEGLVLEIMAHASRQMINKPDRSAPYWLGRARDFLYAHFSETLSHAEIAEAVGVHPVHLAREFKRHYRCTVGEYTRRLRIEYACHKISTTDLSLLEIALAAGFFDQSHFARTFKRLMGVSPAEYREFSRRR